MENTRAKRGIRGKTYHRGGKSVKEKRPITMALTLYCPHSTPPSRAAKRINCFTPFGAGPASCRFVSLFRFFFAQFVEEIGAKIRPVRPDDDAELPVHFHGAEGFFALERLEHFAEQIRPDVDGLDGSVVERDFKNVLAQRLNRGDGMHDFSFYSNGAMEKRGLCVWANFQSRINQFA